MEQNRNNNSLAEKFNNIGNGFYNITPYINDVPGISIKKKMEDDKNASMISIYISNEKYKNNENNKILFIRVIYGEEHTNGGISFRSKPKITEPIDLESKDYYFNLTSKKFFLAKKNKEVQAVELLNKIYSLHIKPTSLNKGWYIRLRLFFHCILVKNLFYYISNFFSFLLLIITKDKYKYTPIFKQETINEVIISSTIPNSIEKEKLEDYLKEKKESSAPKSNLLGIGLVVNTKVLVFYSILHLLFYSFFYFKNIKPLFIINIYKNIFLTAIYIVSSLWIFEKITLWIFEEAIPKIIKYFIREASTISFNSEHKKINL